ncbi:MAG: hypothetical protein H7263_15410 [Candidatus Sericytochromatia bacterium]|nr:hypothetical protein [Candidatus Sericytochromatia bacterium]
MTENIQNSRALIKEIQIDRGVFKIKSEITNKFSASDSYKEQLAKSVLPPDAPKDFKEAIPNLYYAPEHRNLISYSALHHQINQQKEKIIAKAINITDEIKRNAHIESSKKILKDYGINDRALMIYSPQITKKFEESDEFCKITVTFDPEEKILFVKTELLPREKKNLPQEIMIGEMLDLLNHIEVVKDKNFDTNVSQQNNFLLEKVKEHKHPEINKADMDELKKKYNFSRPKTESISDILKRTITKETEQVTVKEEIKSETPTEHLKHLITESLSSLSGEWKHNIFQVDHKKSGYLTAIDQIELKSERICLRSSQVTNIEWWTKFTPIHLCKRFEGALYIPDEWAPFCQVAKCNIACGADDGFVELSAARFRLIEESNIISSEFKRLQQFLDRCYRLIEEFKETFNVEIQLDINSKKPFFYSEINIGEENMIRNYLEAYMTLYPEITDIRGNIDIDNFVLNEDYDPISEDGLVQEAQTYGLQEIVKLGSEDLLHDLVIQKDGKVDGKFYLIDSSKLRYVLKPNMIEAFREDLYMGNVTFKKGLKEVERFLSTTLGGGRW